MRKIKIIVFILALIVCVSLTILIEVYSATSGSISAGHSVQFTPTKIDANVTFYDLVFYSELAPLPDAPQAGGGNGADWLEMKKFKYTLSNDTVKDTMAKNGDNEGVVLPTPKATWDGIDYKFEGWYTYDFETNSYGDKAVYNGTIIKDVIKTNEPMRLFAKYSLDQGIIYTYDSADDVYRVTGFNNDKQLYFGGAVKNEHVVMSNGFYDVDKGLTPVVSVETDAFDGAWTLTHLTVASTVKVIKEFAFPNLGNLGIINLSEGLVTIEDFAFDNCSFVQQIHLPSTVKTVGAGAFNNCRSLGVLTLNDELESIGEGAFEWCSLLLEVEIPPKVTVVPKSAFAFCGSLKTIGLHEDITTIDDEAFRNCSHILTMDIPDKVSYIGYKAFFYCASLDSVNFLKGQSNKWETAKTIEPYAFAYCKALQQIETPTTVSYIGERAFTYCNSLESIVLNEGVVDIGTHAFAYCGNLLSVTIPTTEREISTYCFAYCTSLGSVNMPEGLLQIGEHAFEGCVSLGEIELPTTVTDINAYAFAECGSLASIDFTVDNLGDSGLDNIGEYAFYNCNSLVELTLPSGLLFIGCSAYEDCGSLRDVYLPDTLQTVGDRAFSLCPALINLSVSGNNDFACRDGILYNEDFTELIKVTAKAGSLYNGVVEIPSTVKKIHGGAFEDKDNIHTIVFAEGSAITTIGDSAFKNCANLVTMVVPESVNFIGEHAFVDCHKLTGLEFEGINANFVIVDGIIYTKDMKELINCVSGDGDVVVPQSVEIIDSFAFKDCDHLTSVIFESGSKLTTIESGAFMGCKELISINIANTVTHIGDYAFLDCINLTSFTLASDNQYYSYDDAQGILYDKAKSKIIICLDGAGSITIPYTVTRISARAFEHKTAVTGLIFEGGGQLKYIEEYAFYGSGLVNLVLPWSMKQIDRYAFAECQSLNNVRFDVVLIGDKYFANTTIRTIKEYAFYNCNNMQTIVIPNSVTMLGEKAVDGCGLLVMYFEATYSLTDPSSSSHNWHDNCLGNCSYNTIYWNINKGWEYIGGTTPSPIYSW